MNDSSPRPFEVIQLITSSENHFNNLCFGIRSLASKWLIATFAGAGFVLAAEEETAFLIQRPALAILLCWAGALGMIVLWILDLQVYQKLLNAWFDSRREIEERYPDLPQIRKDVKATQPGGRATNLIMLYYMATSSAPLAFAIVIAIRLYEESRKNSSIMLGTSLGLFVIVNALIFLFSYKKQKP